MFIKFKQFIKNIINVFFPEKIKINWVKKSIKSKLYKQFNLNSYLIPKSSIFSKKIKKITTQTNNLGAQPLWNGYKGNNIGGNTRLPNDVKTLESMGNFYTNLVQNQKPQNIIEFGTAFGVSGMYFLAGLELNKSGKLLTFEVNEGWAKIAEKNLKQISDKFILTKGLFEKNIEKKLTKNEVINLAFVDAIHTQEFVLQQVEIILKYSQKGTLIIIDDIDFSDDMIICWKKLSQDKRFLASLKIGTRVGILEVN